MLLCRTKVFIRGRKEDCLQNQQASSQQLHQIAGQKNSNLQQKNDFFYQTLYQKQNYSKSYKLNRMPSDSELLQKMNTNKYEKIIHKDSQFTTTNKQSYKNLDFKATIQPVHNDKLRLVKINQSNDTETFKSLYQVDFYKQKKPQQKTLILKKKSEKVSFKDIKEIEIKNQLKLKEAKSQKIQDAVNQNQKSIYQLSFQQRPLSSSSISSDSEYEAIKNKKPRLNLNSNQQAQKAKRKSILVNKTNQNIIEKTLFKNCHSQKVL